MTEFASAFLLASTLLLTMLSHRVAQLGESSVCAVAYDGCGSR